MYTYDSIKGTQDIHFVKFVNIGDVNKLLKKELAYFCCFFWIPTSKIV
jgi:hypothetical protein